MNSLKTNLEVCKILQNWIDFILKNEEDFLKMFFPKGFEEVIHVSFSDTQVKVVLIMDSGDIVTNHFNITDFFDWMENFDNDIKE